MKRLSNTIILLTILLLFTWYRQFKQAGVLKLLKYYTDNPTDDIIFNIPIYLYTDDLKLPDVVEATDLQLRTELSKIQYDEVVNFKFDLKYGQRVVMDEVVDNDNMTLLTKFNENAHFIYFTFRDVELLFNNPIERSSEFIFKESTLFNNDFPYFLTQTLVHQIFSDELIRFSTMKFVKGPFGIEPLEKIINRDKLLLQFYTPINLDLDLRKINNSFKELRKLYEVEVILVDQIPENNNDDTFTFIINKLDPSTLPNIVLTNNTIILNVDPEDDKISYDQLLFDIEDNLFNLLHFIIDPQVIPLRVDMELRFQIVNNLMKFVRMLNEKKSSGKNKLNKNQVVELFEFRNEILKLIRENYDWQELYLMSKNLILKLQLL